MKLLIAAAAFAVAAPAAAQTAQTAPAHAEHGSEHHEHGAEHKGCCEHKKADGTPMDCCKPGKDGKRAECCDKRAEHSAERDGHQGHH